jgi:hypothetical protein
MKPGILGVSFGGRECPARRDDLKGDAEAD